MNEALDWKRMIKYLASSLMAVALLTSSALAIGQEQCSSFDTYLAVGQTKTIKGYTIRLEAADFQPELPDSYVISIREVSSGQILLKSAKLIQHRTIQVKSACGELTVGSSIRDSVKDVKFNISFF